jgi:hypothetical protein
MSPLVSEGHYKAVESVVIMSDWLLLLGSFRKPTDDSRPTARFPPAWEAENVGLLGF